MHTTFRSVGCLAGKTDIVAIDRIRTLLSKALVAPLSALVFLSASPCAFGQATASIRGNVIDSSSAPVFGAVVTVRGSDRSSYTTVTDSKGSFQISSLKPGNYSVRISAAGFSDWSASNVPASMAPESKPLRAVM